MTRELFLYFPCTKTAQHSKQNFSLQIAIFFKTTFLLIPPFYALINAKNCSQPICLTPGVVTYEHWKEKYPLTCFSLCYSFIITVISYLYHTEKKKKLRREWRGMGQYDFFFMCHSKHFTNYVLDENLGKMVNRKKKATDKNSNGK